MLKLSIPKPCHEDWEQMTPDQTGRHCSACAKSVIDFTNMSDDEVKHFFINKKEDERVCGRFRQTQLHRIVIELPPNIFSMRMARWKKFLAACLLVFSITLFSCETKIKGHAKGEVGIASSTRRSLEAGTYVGMPAVEMMQADTEMVAPAVLTTQTFEPPPVLQGDIMIMEEPPGNVDSTMEPKKDTGISQFPASPLKQGPAGTLIKTKNPPKADSVNCNTIKNYY